MIRSRTDPRVLGILGILTISLFLTPGGLRAATAPSDTVSLFRGEALVRGDGTPGPFPLPDRLIIPGSESVELEGRRLRAGPDYQLDAIRGLLTLTRSLETGQILYVRYERFPYDLEPVSFHRRMEIAPERSGVIEPHSAPAWEKPGGGTGQDLARLTVAGNKTFSVELGSNQDMTLKQALNLQIGGSVARDVEVRAILSDTDIPLQPEGTTQELEQLDNVLVEVKSTHLSATLGDYAVSITDSRFASLERQLEGVLGRADYDRVRVAAAGAVSKGKFASMEFRGEEGKQGPYQLLSLDGGTYIVVVAGSERVTVFGERMVRGENNDYTIDYADGTIQFTTKRLITEDAEIAVDYEYMTEEYKRGLYFGQTEALDLWGERVDIGMSVFSEQDQKSQPLAEDLTAKDREILAAAGDEEAWVTGATEVGAGEGLYNWIETAPGEGYFIWVGSDSGSYEVRFTELADSSGQYVRRFDDRAGRFIYEYTGRGSYTPRVRLPSPQSHTLADLRWNVRGTRRLTLSGEAALSSLDLNTFSDLDDGDNVGGVYEVRMALDKKPMGLGGRSLGAVSVRGLSRSREERFQSLGRTEAAYYGKRWNLYTTAPEREEQVREAEVVYEPWNGNRMALNYGRLDQGDQFTSIRKEAVASQDWGRGTAVSGVVEKVDSWDKRPAGDHRRKTRRFRSDASARLGGILSQFSFEHDSRDRGNPDSLLWGLRFEEARVSASLADAGAWGASVTVGRRENDVPLGGRWVPKSTSNTTEMLLKYQGAGTLSGGATVSHRRVEYDRRFQDADVTTDLADLDLKHSMFAGRLRNTFNYRISNATRTMRERHYVYVGEGADYDSLGNFVDGEGFYESVTVPGNPRPVTEVVASARFKWQPGPAGSPSGDGWPGHFAAETFLKVDERTTSTDRRRVYLLDPGVLQDDRTTLEGRFTLRQDVFLLPDQPTFSIRLRYEYNDLTDNRFEGLLRDVVEGRRSVLIRSSPREGLGFDVEYLNRWRGEDLEEGGAVQSEERRSHGLKVLLTAWLGARARLALRSQWEDSIDRVSDRKVRAVEMEPKLTYSFLGKGRAESAVTWRGASGDEQTGSFSRIAYTGRPGWEWRLSADYRVGKYVTASLTYSGSSFEGRDTMHSGKSEVRAYF